MTDQEKFEAWASTNPFLGALHMSRMSDGTYLSARATSACGAWQAALASQAAELAALRADAERIDFLHSHPMAVTRSFGYLGAPDVWTKGGDYRKGQPSQAFASLRDAIDAAMAAHKEPSNE